MSCKYYFGRTIKSEEGIPINYEYGCFINQNLSTCGQQCPFYRSGNPKSKN